MHDNLQTAIGKDYTVDYLLLGVPKFTHDFSSAPFVRESIFNKKEDNETVDSSGLLKMERQSKEQRSFILGQRGSAIVQNVVDMAI